MYLLLPEKLIEVLSGEANRLRAWKCGRIPMKNASNLLSQAHNYIVRRSPARLIDRLDW